MGAGSAREQRYLAQRRTSQEGPRVQHALAHEGLHSLRAHYIDHLQSASPHGYYLICKVRDSLSCVRAVMVLASPKMGCWRLHKFAVCDK